MCSPRTGKKRQRDLGGFIFDIPEVLLSESNSGKKSAAGALGASIAGLSVKELKLPALVTGILNDMEDGNMGGLIGKAALVLPFAFVILPVVLMTIEARANRIYKVYVLFKIMCCFTCMKSECTGINI